MIIRANSLARFPIADQSVQCVVTSPPYWALRDYGVEGQIGLEPEVDCLSWARREEPCVACFVCRLRQVFREVWRVLRDDGVCWVNLGDTYIGVGRGAQGDKSALEGSHHNQNASRFAGRPSFRRDKAKVSVDMHKASEGLKVKDLVGAPWRVAFALQADGWYLRQDVIWHKPCAMPESVTDRCTKAHEYLFILTKRRKYYWDAAANKEAVSGGAHARGTGVNPKASGGAGGRKGFPREKQNESFSSAVRGLVDVRNRRSVWTVPSKPFSEAHFAVMPEDLVRPCILASTRPGDVVFDPFAGAGTVPYVAMCEGRVGIGLELNPDYCRMARERCAATACRQERIA